MKHWIGTMVASLAMVAVTMMSPAAQAAVDRSGIDADVQSTLDSFYAQHPQNRELVNKAAAMLVFPRISKAGLGVGGTLDSFYAQHPQNRELVNKAAAMLVFPRISKAGLGVGGEHGHGALLVNGNTVGYYKVSGASVGGTIGVSRSSEIILFMTTAARDKFLRSNGWTIGADVGIAVASSGAGGDYDTETLQRPVVAFVFGEHGLMGDVSLQGAKITKLQG